MPLRAEYSSVKSKRCCAQESVSMSTEVWGGGGGGGILCSGHEEKRIQIPRQCHLLFNNNKKQKQLTK